MVVNLEKTKTRFSVEPYEALTIQVDGETFDLGSTAPFSQWHHSALRMDCFGVRLDSGRVVDLRVVTESPVNNIYGTRHGYYSVNVISAEEAAGLRATWAAAES
jgi:hypothetical protein